MDFTISEATALFTTPFMLTMGEAAYNLMDELGLIFIPFTIAIVQCFFESKTQGADEGAEAVVFIKALEARFIPMIVILLVAVMPSTSQTPNFKFAAYACADAPSIISGADNVTSLKPNTNFASLYGNSNPPMLFGFVNQIGAAINGAGIGKLNCSAGTNRNEAAEIMSNLELHVAVNIKAVREFDSQCYTKALSKLNRLKANNDTLTVDFNESPYDTLNAYAFNSTPMNKVYSGTITSPSDDYMYFTVPDYWSEIDDSESNDAIKCTEAEDDITAAILSDLINTSGNTRSGSWIDLVNKVMTVINTTNGNTYTFSEAKEEMIRSAYRNSATNWYNPLLKRSSVEKTPSTETRVGMNANEVKGMSTQITEKHEAVGNNAGVTGLAYFGALWSNLSKSIETMTYMRVTPILVSITQGGILAFGGIILVLSGYSSRTLLHLLLFYFSLSLVPFFMNVGLIFDTVISGLIDNKTNGLNITNMSVIEVADFASKSIILLCPLAWLTLVQLLGIHASQTFDMAGLAQNAKQTANAAISAISSKGSEKLTKGNKHLAKKAKSKISDLRNRK